MREPGEDEPLYRGLAYAPPSARVDGLVEPLRKLGEWAQVLALGPLGPGSRIFEVGAGDGRLLRRLARSGHTVEGTEPFADSGATNIVRTPVEALELERGGYDVVILWHVLEHLDDPYDAVARLVPALKQDGRLVVAVPNLASFQARLGGDRWFHQDVPRHSLHFTPAGLHRLVERAGLRVTPARTMSPDQNVLGMTQTMLTLLTRRRDLGFGTLKHPHANIGDVVLAALASAVLAPVAIVVESVAVLTGHGGSIVFRASPRR